MLSDSFSCCILLKEANNYLIPFSSSRLERPGPEPKKVHQNANEQRERLRWILSFVYYKCKGTQPSEVLRLQHNLSLILRRWLDESRDLRENILFFQSSPLDKFEPEEQCFRKMLGK